jgi:putative transposase
MKQHRHTLEEIAAKLEEADAMSTRGTPHGDIAKALGISVMTYHRWRKARDPSRFAAPSPSDGVKTNGPTNPISDLQLENARLRRVVTDLLLEKMDLEESIQDRAVRVKSASRI